MNQRHLTTLVCLSTSLTLIANDTNAQIVIERADHLIVAQNRYPDAPLVEPLPAVNPTNPEHLVIGTIVAPVNADSPWHCAALASWDDGVTWSRHDFSMQRCIDPWVTFLPNGDLLFVGIELLDDVEGDDRFHLVSFRSEDGGRNWSETSRSIGHAHEHAVLLTDRSTATDGTVYLASRRMRRAPDGSPRHRIFLARSTNNGHTFANLAELRPSNLALNVTGIARLSDQRIAVAFWDFQRNVDGFEGAGMLARGRSWLYLSRDDGETFQEPHLISDNCASGIEGAFPGYPIFTAYSTSTGGDEYLYHACVRPALNGIALTSSSDGGEVWSDALRVDTQTPVRPANTRTPMLAVNAFNTVGIAWYDRRHDPDHECQDVYFTASIDSGQSVLRPVRISTETSCPGTESNGRAARSWPMGGDYSSLAAGPDGRFHLVWADSRSGRFRLHHAALTVRR